MAFLAQFTYSPRQRRAKSREHVEDTSGSVPDIKLCMWLRTQQGCGHCASLGAHPDFHL